MFFTRECKVNYIDKQQKITIQNTVLYSYIQHQLHNHYVTNNNEPQKSTNTRKHLLQQRLDSS